MLELGFFDLLKTEGGGDSNTSKYLLICHTSEAATGGVLFKKLFLKISQYSQENTCVGVSFY